MYVGPWYCMAVVFYITLEPDLKGHSVGHKNIISHSRQVIFHEFTLNRSSGRNINNLVFTDRWSVMAVIPQEVFTVIHDTYSNQNALPVCPSHHYKTMDNLTCWSTLRACQKGNWENFSTEVNWWKHCPNLRYYHQRPKLNHVNGKRTVDDNIRIRCEGRRRYQTHLTVTHPSQSCAFVMDECVRASGQIGLGPRDRGTSPCPHIVDSFQKRFSQGCNGSFSSWGNSSQHISPGQTIHLPTGHYAWPQMPGWPPCTWCTLYTQDFQPPFPMPFWNFTAGVWLDTHPIHALAWSFSSGTASVDCMVEMNCLIPLKVVQDWND